jgi:hypothetical protein
MYHRALTFLLILCSLTALPACQPGVTLSDPTPEPASPTTPAAALAPTPNAVIDQATALPALSAEDTFVVIAALHANLNTLSLWGPNPPSPFERHAVIRPLLEIGMGPLGEILPAYQPPEAFLAEWQAAGQLYAEVYPQALVWADGELGDDPFWALHESAAARAADLVREAEEIAAGLGVQTGIYGPPEYLGAAQAVFRLLPAAGTQADADAGDPVSEVLPPREDVPGLQAVEVKPFLYPFAGSDVFVVVGLVEHTGTAPLADVLVEVRFYNYLDEHLGTSAGRLLADVALPGAVYPFSATTVTEGEEAALKDWTRYEVAITARPADQASYQFFTFELLSAEPTASGGIEVRGLLTNVGMETVSGEQVWVGVAARDAAGVLVGVGEGYLLDPVELASGASAEFRAQIEAVSGVTAEYWFLAEVRSFVP